MKISAIGFDWGGVIYQNPGGSFHDAAASFLNVEDAEFRRAYFLHNHMVNKGAGMSYGDAVEMWREILSELKIPDRLDAYMEFVRARPEGFVSGEMVALVRQLKDDGWNIGLLSNTSIEGAQAIRSQPCFSLFDAAIFSAEIGAMKPEPETFLTLATALGVDVRELVFIDDSEKSLSTADEVGYVPVRFTDIGTLKDRLGNLGIRV